MSAQLRALSGPLEGNVFPLLDTAFSIGRDKSNGVALVGDPGTSRRHCVITATDEQFTIRDLDSHNRTFVNGREVHDEQLLVHGDEILIGHSRFVFLIDGQPVPHRPTEVDLDDGEKVNGTTTTVVHDRKVSRIADALLDATAASLPSLNAVIGAATPSPSTPPESLQENHAMTRGATSGVPTDTFRAALATAEAASLWIGAPPDLSAIMQAMLRVCRAVSSQYVLRDLQRKLVEAILNVVPAGRAAVLLVGNRGDEFGSAFHCTRSDGEVKSFRIPRTVIQRVLNERSALCMNDLLTDASSGTTVAQSSIHSLAGVPVIAHDAVIGAIYVDTSDPAVRFNHTDARLLMLLAETVAVPLSTALRVEQLERENERLAAELPGSQLLIGASERMRVVRRFIAKVAAGDSTVLVLGASGTGKELVARAIHRNSRRSRKPFVAINCAALTESLIESELFGHEKGAFTGAFAQTKGKLEEAHGGTIFLDEIGELALSLQAKLLRVLQEREFQRVGGTRPITVDIRVIAATNRDLAQDVRRGAFRQDLYFRLNVVSMTMPELRERKEDIPLLARHFLDKHAGACGRRVVGLSEEALACLVSYDWPGNIRELENAVERALVLGTTDRVLPDDLPESVLDSAVTSSSSASATKFYETIREIKKQLVTKALEHSHGSYAEAAKRLGLHPNNLHRLMKTLNLKPLPQ